MIAVGAVAVLAVSLTVLVHLAALRRLSIELERFENRAVLAPLVLIFSLLLAHVLEIWVFAVAYVGLTGRVGVGELSGLSGSWSDYAYFSGTAYTTVGFGDIVPNGPIRLLTALEALTGLLMVAWSASFTFLQMNRIWGSR